jgi:Protein of unknown function (DUF2842)
MPRKARQIIGAVVLLIFIPFYALVVMALANTQRQGSSLLTAMLYFAVAGLVWIVPAGAIILWMQRR